MPFLSAARELAAAAILLAAPLRAQASSPAAARYSDAAGIAVLTIPDPAGGRKPVLVEKRHVARLAGRPFLRGGKTYVWDKVGRVGTPSRALISVPALAVVLIGARGDPGFALGQVEVRTYEGAVLKDIDLRDLIPDLDTASAALAKASGLAPDARPWILDARVSRDGFSALIRVAGGKSVVLNLVDLRASVREAPAKR